MRVPRFILGVCSIVGGSAASITVLTGLPRAIAIATAAAGAIVLTGLILRPMVDRLVDPVEPLLSLPRAPGRCRWCRGKLADLGGYRVCGSCDGPGVDHNRGPFLAGGAGRR